MSWFDRHGPRYAIYGTAALIALTELGIVLIALKPDVPDTFRAYYIDRTTTCLPQAATGEYRLGAEIDFTAHKEDAGQLLPCGWTGPTDIGRHSLGTTSRLRFAIERPQPLTLTLELAGTTAADNQSHRVVVALNDHNLGEIRVEPGNFKKYEFRIPGEILTTTHADVVLSLPDAVQPRFGIADVHWQSVTLRTALLTAAD